MKPENKVIRDIFDPNNHILYFKDTFGQEGFMFAWTYEDLLKLEKKYPYLTKKLGLDCRAFEDIIKARYNKNRDVNVLSHETEEKI